MVDAAGGGVMVALDDPGRVPSLVALLVSAGIRLTRVEPHRPTLEELYLLVRRTSGWSPAGPVPEVRR